jgi:hypothetical protein
VDGTQVAQSNFGSFTPQTSTDFDLYFGIRFANVGPFNGYIGSLDEAGIFDRALSVAEIQAIVDAGTGGMCKDEDGDGFRPPADCDEIDPNVNPDAVEINFNFVDENCDGNLGECDPCVTWQNHGQYVRCVADAVSNCSTNDFTSEEADAFVSSAVHSDIGKSGFVPPECLAEGP